MGWCQALFQSCNTSYVCIFTPCALVDLYTASRTKWPHLLRPRLTQYYRTRFILPGKPGDEAIATLNMVGGAVTNMWIWHLIDTRKSWTSQRCDSLSTSSDIARNLYLQKSSKVVWTRSLVTCVVSMISLSPEYGMDSSLHGMWDWQLGFGQAPAA